MNVTDPYYVLIGPDLMYSPTKEYERFWPYIKKIKRLSEWSSLGFDVDLDVKILEPEGTQPLNIWFSQISDSLALEYIQNRNQQLNSHEIIKSQKESKLLTNEWIIDELVRCSEDYYSLRNLTQSTLDINDAKICYNTIIGALKYLSEFEECTNFNNLVTFDGIPSNILRSYQENPEQYLFIVFNNSLEYSLQKIRKLKTTSARQNSKSKILDKINRFSIEIKSPDIVSKIESVRDTINGL